MTGPLGGWDRDTSSSLCENSTQQGFRPGRSCLSALLDVFDNIMHMLDSDSSVDMVYLDFSKAFDKVDQWHPFA